MTAPYPATALEPEVTSPLILALPKGRILAECGALLARAGVAPAPDYADEESRRLRFPTDDPALDVVRVRPFDVATFVAFGAAQLARISQCAPTARFTSGGRIHPGSCR